MVPGNTARVNLSVEPGVSPKNQNKTSTHTHKKKFGSGMRSSKFRIPKPYFT